MQPLFKRSSKGENKENGRKETIKDVFKKILRS